MEPVQTFIRATTRVYERVGAQFILLGTSLGLLYFLLYFFLNSGFTPPVFDALVNPMFRGDISWTRLGWGPKPGNIRILEPVLTGADGNQIIGLRSLRVEEFDLESIPSGTIAARGLILDRPTVRLKSRISDEVLDAFGQPSALMNIAEMFMEPGPPYDPGAAGNTTLRFTDIELRNGDVEIALPAIQLAFKALDVENFRFELKSRAGRSQITMGAAGLSTDRGTFRLNQEAASATANDQEEAIEKPLPSMTWHIEKLKGTQFSWRDNAFDLARLNATVQGDALSIHGLAMALDAPGLPSMKGNINLVSDDVAHQLEPLGIKDINGPLEVNIKANGELDALSAHVDVQGGPIAVPGGIGIEEVKLKAEQTTEGQAFIHDLSVSALGGTVRAVGEAHLFEDTAWVDVDIDGVEITGLPVELTPLVTDLIDGGLQGTVLARVTELQQPTRRLSANADLTLNRRGPRIFGLRETIKVETAARLVGDNLEVFGLKLDSGADHVRARGLLALNSLVADLQGQIKLDGLKPVLRSLKIPLDGQVNARWDLKGSLKNPDVNADITGRRLQYQQFPRSDLDAKVEYVDGGVKVHRLNLNTERGSATASGSVGVSEPSIPMNLKLRVADFDIESLPFDFGVSGIVGADIKVGGGAKRPLVSGRAKVSEPCWDSPHRVENLCLSTVVAEGQWNGKRIEVSEAKVFDDEGPLITARGEYGLKDQEIEANVAIDGFSLPIVNYFVPKPLPLEGKVHMDIEAGGTVKAPTGNINIELDGIEYDIYDLGEARLNVVADGSFADLKGQLFGLLTLEARSPLQPDNGRLEAKISFDELKVEDHLPQLIDVPLETSLSGEVTADLDPFSGELGTIRARFPQMDANYSLAPKVRYLLNAKAPAEIRFEKGVVHVDALDLGIRQWEDLDAVRVTDRRVLKSSGIGLTGTVDLLGPMDLEARGGVQFELLEPFLNSVFTRSRGRADFRMKLGGTIAEIRPSLDLVLRSAEFVPRSSVVGGQIELVRPVRFTLGLPGNDEAVAESEELPPVGTFDFALAKKGPPGNERTNQFQLLRDQSLIEIDKVLVKFKDFAPDRIGVHLLGSELSVNVPGVMRATVTTPGLGFDMWKQPLEGRPPEQRMKLTGDIRVLRGEYTSNITGANQLNQSFRDNLGGKTQVRSVNVFERIPLLKRLMLDLSVTGDGDFFVRNQVFFLNLDLDLRLDLHTISGFLVSMPHDAPEDKLKIEGEVDILADSTVTYARRDFTVSRGIINLGGVNFLNADIEANHTFRLTTNTASSGSSTSFDEGGGDVRLEEVQLQASLRLPLMSSPPITKLSLTSSSGASQFQVAMLVLTGSFPEDLSGAASAQPATEVLLAPLLSLVERPLEDTLNVDLSLTPDTGGSLFIDADKILSRRLRLYSRVMVGDDDEGSPQRFGLEYQINNIAYGELASEQTGSLVSTSGRLRLRLDLDEL